MVKKRFVVVVFKKKKFKKRRERKTGRSVLCVTQSGLRPVVSQWDEQSAAMCRQSSPVSPDNMDNSAPYGPSGEGHFPALHTDERALETGRES